MTQHPNVQTRLLEHLKPIVDALAKALAPWLDLRNAMETIAAHPGPFHASMYRHAK